MILPIEIDQSAISAFCERHHIAKLSFFGSVLTNAFGPDSDVDALVEFEPSHVPGLIALSRMESELSGILGRKADIRTPKDMSSYFRDQVLQSALTQYVA